MMGFHDYFFFLVFFPLILFLLSIDLISSDFIYYFWFDFYFIINLFHLCIP